MSCPSLTNDMVINTSHLPTFISLMKMKIRNLSIDFSRFNLSDHHKNKQQQNDDKNNNICLTTTSHKEEEEEMDYTISTNHSINSTSSHSILSL